MFPYIAVTGFIAIMALLFPSRRKQPLLWLFAFILLLIFVGLRHHVGMDWNNYLIMIKRAAGGTLVEATKYSEPLYAAMLWSAGKLGFGVYGSNLVGTLIFMLGLFSYARTTPAPWLALLVAMPVLVVVIAMSANRQAVAIGVLLWIISHWDTSSLTKRAIFICIAAMFHSSAVMFLVFTVADLHIRTSFKIILSGVFMAAIFVYMSSTGQYGYYDSMYVAGQTKLTRSPGATYHVMLNGGPALIYFLLRRLRPVLLPNDIHRHMALLAVILIPASFVASTASGRIGMYLFPVSMYILTALPAAIKSNDLRNLYRIGLILFLVFVTVFWLRYSNSGIAHLPYRNFFTVDSYLRPMCC